MTQNLPSLLSHHKKTLFAVTPALRRDIHEALHQKDVKKVRRLVKHLHPADIADLLKKLGSHERHDFLVIIRPHFDPDILTYLESPLLEQVVDTFDPSRLASAVKHLESDDAASLIEELDKAHQTEILEKMSLVDRLSIEQILSYPPDSAGRLMQREVVVVPAFWTVDQATQFIKGNVETPDVFYEIFVVDPKYHPIGSVPLSHLLRHKKDAVIEHIMTGDIKAIPVSMDQEEVAQLFQQYVLLSAPVIDASGRIIGMITVDDVVDVIVQEAEEDLFHVAGIKEVHTDTSIVKSAYQRIQWLFATLLNTIIASIVISHFQHTIEHHVTLAILMPIAAAMGGNAGMQVVTITVRAIAMRELIATSMWRTVFKEVMVCGNNGMVFGLLLGFFAATWFSDPRLGYILGGAMMFNMLWAGLIGTLLPILIARIKMDPAIGAGPMLTTATDVMGYTIFLGLATMVLLGN